MLVQKGQYIKIYNMYICKGRRGILGTQGIKCIQGVHKYTLVYMVNREYIGIQGIKGVRGYTGSRWVHRVYREYMGIQGIHGIHGYIGYTGVYREINNLLLLHEGYIYLA